MKISLKQLTLLIGATAALAAGTAGQAASTAQLKITGKILPVACNITLGDNGVVDYDVISHKTLEAEGTDLAEKTVPLNITCEGGSARVGLKVTDNQASSRVSKGDLTGAKAWVGRKASTLDDTFVYGLGTTTKDGKSIKIGGVMLGLKGGVVTADGKASMPVLYSEDNQNWNSDSTLRQYLSSKYTYSFVNAAANKSPDMISSMSGVLSVIPTLNKKGELPGDQAVDLAGNVTLTLVYL